MDLESLRIIATLATDPHLSRAAERLRVSQPTLSKRLQAIEAELGFQLFERRGPRGMRPLPSAHELARVAERMLEHWEGSLLRFRESVRAAEKITIVGPELFLREVVLPWWLDAPRIMRLELLSTSISRISAEALRLGVDFAILEHKEELADFVCRPLYRETWGIVRHPRSKLKLREHRWGTPTLINSPVETWLVKRQRIPQPTYHLVSEDLTALANWVAESPDAATVLPWHAVRALADEGRVSFEKIRTEAKSQLFLAYERGNPHTDLVQSLVKFAAGSNIPK